MRSEAVGTRLAILGIITVEGSSPMVIDFTAQLAPLLWGMVALLLVLGGAILASVDFEAAEIYLGQRTLLLATAALLALTIAALALARTDIAAHLGVSG
jgi:hypothetical protein